MGRVDQSTWFLLCLILCQSYYKSTIIKKLLLWGQFPVKVKQLSGGRVSFFLRKIVPLRMIEEEYEKLIQMDRYLFFCTERPILSVSYRIVFVDFTCCDVKICKKSEFVSERMFVRKNLAHLMIFEMCASIACRFMI